MKKILSISLIAVIGFIAFSFTTPKTTDVAESLKSKKVVIVEEDAIYCKVTRSDGSSVTCWFCNCAGIVKSMQQRQKVKVLLK